MDTKGGIILLIASVLVCAFFTLVTTAQRECNKIRIKQSAQEKKLFARAALVLLNKRDAVRLAAYTGMAVSSLAAYYGLFRAIYVKLLYGRWYENPIPAALFAFAGTAFLLAVFASFIPSLAAKKFPDAVFCALAPLAFILCIILLPVIILPYLFALLIKKLVPGAKKETEYTESELSDMIERVEQEGVLEGDESELIQSALEFKDTVVSSVMCPIDKAFALSVNQSKGTLVKALTLSGYSRVPVYKEDKNVFFGILRAGDYLTKYVNDSSCDIRRFIAPPIYVSPQARLTTVMNEMKKRKMHMAIVRGGDRRVLGIVTLQDLIDEIIGKVCPADDKKEEVTQD